MKTVTIFSVLLFFAVLLSGCIREEIAPSPGSGRVLTVNYSFDNPQTRVAGVASESIVTDVAVLFYNADDTDPAAETYVGWQGAAVQEGSGATGSFPLALPDGIIQGNKYKLLIIGNYKKYAPKEVLDTYVAQYATYSKMKQEIQGRIASNEESRVTTPLPFRGWLQGQDGNETTLVGPSPTGAQQQVSVKFSRAVSRFDVTNLAADQLKIAWVKVCNYRSRGYFFHESMLAGEVVRGTSAEAPGVPLPSPAYPGYVAAPSPAPSGAAGSLVQKLNGGGLYAFPNIVSYTSQDDKATTSLMVAGYFKEKGASDYSPKLTYYRANMSENGSSQILRRNYIYTLVINSVKKAGSDTEDGAVNEKEQLLGYEVGEDWESDEGSTVTDGAGNYLTLSRTTVVLGSEQDASALIKVAVKKEHKDKWTLEWKTNPDGAFRYDKAGDNSFSITTTRPNESSFTHNATLTVRVTELPMPLELTVNVIQLSSVNDPQMLTVEGKLGAFDYTIPGQGAEISLQVITGSPTSRWKAESDANLDRMLTSYTKEGANKGFVVLSFLANTGQTRQGTLTVKRLLPDGNEDLSVDPVKVTFKQDKSPYVVSLLPNYSVSGLTIEGFQAVKGTANGIVKNIRFNVLLADPLNYTWKATCSFNKNSDAFITKGNENTTATAGPLQTSKDAPSSVEGIHGENIWLNVFRTGPGDVDIPGELRVTAVPNDPSSELAEFTYSVSITIKTSCKIGDSKIGNILWADRNVGATPRGDGGAAVGLNYTNDTKSDDYANTDFKGDYYSWTTAKEKCTTFGESNHYEGELATGWRLPSNSEQMAVANEIWFSKQRGFIVSSDKTQGTVGCWFPLSGYASAPTGVYGYFWSSTTNGTITKPAYYLSVSTGSASTPGSGVQSYGYSVRCVR